MLKSINKFIINNEYSINIWKNYIEINNFTDLILLEDNEVIIEINKKIIKIKGKEIYIKKLVDKEILLSGDFETINLGEKNV